MKRVESTLRHISMLFIVLNLLSPLSVSYAMAQTLPPAAPQEEQAPPPAESQVIETVDTTGSSEQQAPAPVVEPAVPEPANEPQESTGQSPPADSPETENGGQPAPSMPETQPTPVTPVLPSIANGYCAEDGVTLVPASVVAAPNTDTTTYTLQGPDASGAFTVVASLVNNDTTVWSADTFIDWADAGNNTVAFSGTVTTAPCPVVEQPTETETPTEAPTEAPTETPADLIKVTPQDPTIEDGVCKDGKAIAPKVTPAETTGITYELTGPDEKGTFALTATLQDGYTWGDTFSDWGVDGNVATYVKTTVAIEPCAPVKRSLATQNNDTAAYTIQKSVDPSTVAQGMDITYTIVVGWGPEVANTPFKITDLIPAPLTNASSTGCTFVVPDGAVDCSGGGAGGSGTVLTWNVNPNGYTGSVYITVKAHVPTGTAGSVVTNYAYVGDVGSKIVAANTFTVLDKLPEVVKTQPGIVGVGQAQCLDGAVTTPTLTLPVTTGVTYSAFPSGPYNPGQTVTVTATLNPGYAFNTKDWPNGWTQTSDVTATYTVKFNTASCKDATPKAGTPSASVCREGAVEDPTYQLPGNTSSVHYSNLTSTDNGGSITFSFKATLQNGYAWTNPSGWPANGGSWTKNSPTQATYTITIDKAKCASATPVNPTVKNGVCQDGAYTAPVISTTNSAAITYSVSGPDSNGNFTVTATLKDGYAWGTMPQGWAKVQGSNTQAQFKGKVELNNCDKVTPVKPVATQAVCQPGGSYSTPTLTPADGASIDGITYTRTGTVAVGNTVTVTATLSNGQMWTSTTLGNGWVWKSSTTAEWKVTFATPNCGTVKPAQPQVDGNVCKDGIFTEPTIKVGQTSGITYQVGAVGSDGKYIVTATITGTQAWASDLGPNWTRDSATKATYHGQLTFNRCTPVAPVDPTVKDGVCTDGSYTAPAVSTRNTDAIHYSVSGPDNNGKYTVTATLQDGYSWGTMPQGWTQVPGSTTKATFTTRVVKTNECDQVTPVKPVATQAVCQPGGTFSRPSLTPANGATIDGITYTYTGSVEIGNTVKVTATLSDGQAWTSKNLGNGWTWKSSTTAEWSVAFTQPNCGQLTPITPVATQAVCNPGGTFTDPTLTPANGHVEGGITYTYDATKVKNDGGSVVITATLSGANKWGNLNGTGWTVSSQDATKATYTVIFTNVQCGTVSPATPVVNQAVCQPDGSIAAPSFNVGPTANIDYSWTPDTATNGGSVTITATLKGANSWGDLNGWDRKSDTQATYTINFKNVKCQTAQLANPVIQQAVCLAGGEIQDPALSIGPSAGVTYAFNWNDVRNGGTVTITATLDEGYAWGTTTGWSTTNNPRQLTRDVTFQNIECASVLPVAPLVNEAVCTDGTVTTPSYTKPTTTGIVYTYSDEDLTPGGGVTVTATVQQGYAFGTLKDGWTMVEGSTTQATLRVSFKNTTCTEIQLATPDVSQAVCTEGELKAPTVTIAETDGVTYVISPESFAPGSKVVITATVEDGYGWPTTLPGNWVKENATTATNTFTLDSVECEQVIPAAPQVSNAVCTEGALTDPQVLLQETDGITYTMEGAVINGGTVVVTATLAEGKAWGEMPQGWDVQSPTTATYTVVLDDVQCTPVIPVNPDVVNTVCVEGGLTDPSVTPATTEGIVYAMDGDVVNGGTVIVTATIQDGFAWGEMPAGWEKIDNATATFTVQLDDVSCTDVVPAAPHVTNTVCTEGGLTDPSITLADTDGVVYSYNMEDVVNGGTVLLTATIQDGYAWGDLSGSGWTMQDAATATFTVVLEQVECTPVVPANPIVTNAVCTGGALTVPTMTTGKTDGIAYAFNQEDVKNGGTVTITATLGDGYEWGIMPEGWTRVDSVTATYTVQFDDAECEVGLPENPVIAAPACVDGQVTKPSITLPTSDDIVYTMTGDVVPGGTVVVTATVVDGYAWESTELEGWTFVDAATATYTVQFGTAECPPVTPETPVDPVDPVDPAPQSPASPVSALPVTGTGSVEADSQALAILMLSTAALALATIAFGIRRRATR